MQRELPADFDWVKARHDCSTPNFFERLATGAERNVDRRNQVAAERGPVDGGVRFSFVRERARFSVVFEGQAATGVRVRLASERIIAEGLNIDVQFEGVLTFSDDAHCRLRVGAEELDEWQVLRRALEPLFFPA